jgi:hypothetical protein
MMYRTHPNNEHNACNTMPRDPRVDAEQGAMKGYRITVQSDGSAYDVSSTRRRSRSCRLQEYDMCKDQRSPTASDATSGR